MIVNKFISQAKFKEINGSITNPENGGLRLILSVADLEGKFNDPQLEVFDKKWHKIRSELKGWYALRGIDYRLGNSRTTAVQSDIWVLHMLCLKNDVLDEKALKSCVDKLSKTAQAEKATVHVSQLLLDKVPQLLDLVKDACLSAGIGVCVYKG